MGSILRILLVLFLKLTVTQAIHSPPLKQGSAPGRFAKNPRRFPDVLHLRGGDSSLPCEDAVHRLETATITFDLLWRGAVAGSIAGTVSLSDTLSPATRNLQLHVLRDDFAQPAHAVHHGRSWRGCCIPLTRSRPGSGDGQQRYRRFRDSEIWRFGA